MKKTIDLRSLERLPSGQQNGKLGPLGIMLHSTGKEPITDANGEQARVTVAAYVAQCIRSQAFAAATGIKDQLQLAMFLDEVHEAVAEQLEKDDGLLVIEGSHADPVCLAVLQTQIYANPAVLPSLVPTLKAFKNPIDGDLRKKLAVERDAIAAEPQAAPDTPAN